MSVAGPGSVSAPLSLSGEAVGCATARADVKNPPGLGARADGMEKLSAYWPWRILARASWLSAVVGGFAVRADVEALAFFLFGDAQTNHQVNDLVGDQ